MSTIYHSFYNLITFGFIKEHLFTLGFEWQKQIVKDKRTSSTNKQQTSTTLKLRAPTIPKKPPDY